MHWSGSVGGCLRAVSLGGEHSLLSHSVIQCHTVSYSVTQCHTVSPRLHVVVTQEATNIILSVYSACTCKTCRKRGEDQAAGNVRSCCVLLAPLTLHVGELTLSGEGVGCGDGEGGWSGGTLDNTMATHVP